MLQIKKKQAKNGKPLSMGFGFVEFDTVDTAKMVCQNLQVLTTLLRTVLHLIVLVLFDSTLHRKITLASFANSSCL